jgi:molybdenum cofactor cytidylyltransferase
LLLGGGRSARFGSPKLLASFRGRPLVAHAVEALRLAGLHPLAVVRLGDAALVEALEAIGCEVLETDRAERGMGASLAAGVEATAEAPGWLVALADMPSIDPATLRAVNAALVSGAAIALPVLRASGQRGHPVGFAASLRAELLALDGDVGARAVVQRHADAVVEVGVDDPGILADVDTPDDLRDMGSRPSPG